MGQSLLFLMKSKMMVIYPNHQNNMIYLKGKTYNMYHLTIY